ncbi:pentapeptide repeat-containing protein [Kitasatospora sp. NPDC058063]|uniref:pentapeptide repeat-containing protein n=1 Tax=unclassified Kitasatospora TaxID=2633591 RepID=UPI0036DCDB6B
MPSPDRDAYIGSLTAGSDLDLRGTAIDEMLLGELLTACTDPTTGLPRLGRTDFAAATFTGTAWFAKATFTGNANFAAATFASNANFAEATFASNANFAAATFTSDSDFAEATFTGNANFAAATFTSDSDFAKATFTGNANFAAATFIDNANFAEATFASNAKFSAATFASNANFAKTVFNSNAWFAKGTFNSTAWFAETTFNSTAWFAETTFTGTANFAKATFTGIANFAKATFNSTAVFNKTSFAGDLDFHSAVFEGLQHLGPLVCAGKITFDSARLTGKQVTIEAAAAAVTYERTVFEGSAVLRLRYATVQLSRAALSAPMAVQAWPVPFTTSGGTALDESLLAAGANPPDVKLTSLDGVDAAHLVLTDIDLTLCQFTGAFHLDQIQIGFGCRFAQPPTAWHHRGALLARWSRRKVLAEEQHWRAQVGGRVGHGWPAGPHHGAPERGAGPDDLVGVYQQLRKAFEEAGNEPDAADFYYGEMEMRRRDAQRPRAERRLLGVYWLTSGYGLRASRALSWLLVAMGATLALMVLFGLPNDTPEPQTTGTYNGGTVQVTTKAPDPVLSLPWDKRITAARAEKAALVVVNSVVFRSSGQNLTLPGTVIEMASRVGEPVLGFIRGS